MVSVNAGPGADDLKVAAPPVEGGCGFSPRAMTWLVWSAALFAAAPPLIAGARAAASGWYPAGDDSYAAIRARDIFSAHPPLLGFWSSASLYTGHQVNHPGPLLFDLLAVPVRLFGAGPGVALGTALINSAAALGTIWLARRIGGPTLALLTAASVATLMFSIENVLYKLPPETVVRPGHGPSTTIGEEMIYNPFVVHPRYR